jgi:hypothetical protein
MVVVAPDRDEAMHGFGTLSLNELTEGQTIDVVVAAPNATDHLLAMVPPFYRRQAQHDAPPQGRRRWFGRT